jgi:hypothetical protein
MLMNELPFAFPPFEAVRFARNYLLGSAVFERDVHPLHRAHDAHIAV